MNCRVFYRAGAERDLASLRDPVQTKIRTAIKALAGNPRPPGCKKLVAMGNAYRIRVGKYRVGYLIVDRQLIVTIIAIAERGKIYPLLKRRLLG